MTRTRSTLRKWLAACTAGELLGFGAAALFAWLAFRLFGAEPVALHARIGVLVLMVLAGVVEGTVLGSFQFWVLRSRFPALAARSWIGATAAVAALGWFLGMLPPTFIVHDAEQAQLAEPPLWLVLVAAAVFGALAGAAFGFAQWLVLRHHARDATRWIWANALGWALGLPFSYLAGDTADISKSFPLAVLIGTLAGALMGACVAFVTGRALLVLQPLGSVHSSTKSPPAA